MAQRFGFKPFKVHSATVLAESSTWHNTNKVLNNQLTYKIADNLARASAFSQYAFSTGSDNSRPILKGRPYKAAITAAQRGGSPRRSGCHHAEIRLNGVSITICIN